MKTDLFQAITDRIAAQLEQGVRPWAQPWTNGKACVAIDLPHNIAGRAYRGANAFWLMMHGQAMGYPSACWLTFNQAKAKGGNVRKGEKGVAVFFWKFDKVKDKATGEDVKRVMVRQYTVFNVAQCEGITAPTFAPKGNLFERVQAAEAMIAETGARIEHGGAQAFFVPSLDYVQMPPREAFKSADGYYSTLFHELGHWTGHESRLGREFGRKFGDPKYAFEELVAELTSAFVCGSQGFASVEREDGHASYIANWLKVLKDEPRAFITAASLAQKAADLIIGTTFGEKADDEAEPAADELAKAA